MNAIFTRRLFTIAIALLGTAVFLLLRLPLPFLFGPMFACLVAALAGARLKGIGPASTLARIILGIAVGASLTPEVLHQVPQMAGSVAFIPLYILLIGLVGVPFFHRVCGFDLPTSYYAAMPGGLQDMVLFGKEAGGDPRALSLIHATRVLIVVTIAPLVLFYLFDRPLTHPVGEPVQNLPLGELTIMAAAGIVGWKIAERIGMFGATILGPMIMTGLLAFGGFIEHRPPREAILAAQFFIGIGISAGYVGVTLRELRGYVTSGLVFVLFLAALAALITKIVVLLGFATPVEGFLAFAPGGQAEMTVLALVAGADLGFVVVHHLVRLTLVILGAPIFAALVRVRKKEE